MAKTTTRAKKTADAREAKAGDVKITYRGYCDGNLLGFASVTFYGELTVHECRIYEGKDGHPWLAFPSSQGKDGKYYNKVYLDKNSDLNDQIAEALDKLELV